MDRALQLAARGKGTASPNPMVGAVIVKDGKIVGEGWHEQAGLPHAERVALANAGENSRGAELYVTLEPCAHNGRTGPCADAIIAAGIKKVFVAMRDPNPLVDGKGIAKLCAAGVAVEEGLLADDAALLNEVFLKWITSCRPFVVAKYAMSLDGKIATASGQSKWISCEQSRSFTHKLRNQYDAIMVGCGTVKIDDPALTCRLPGGKNPIRIIVDSKAGIDLSAQVLADGLAKTIVVATDAAPLENIRRINELEHAEAVILPAKDGRVDLLSLMDYLGKQNVTSILLEGGATLHAAMLEENLVDKVHAFIAPIIIAGKTAPGPVGGTGADRLAEAWRLDGMSVQTIGVDVLISGYIKKEKE